MAPILAHFDSSLPISLATDASPYGVGAVLSYNMPDGTDWPIAFASRTLSGAEHGYALVEKEALSLVFGVTNFHQYLYGRRFSLLTDHKPAQAWDPTSCRSSDATLGTPTLGVQLRYLLPPNNSPQQCRWLVTPATAILIELG